MQIMRRKVFFFFLLYIRGSGMSFLKKDKMESLAYDSEELSIIIQNFIKAILIIQSSYGL